MRNSSRRADGVVGEVTSSRIPCPRSFPASSCSRCRLGPRRTSSAWPASGPTTAGWRISAASYRARAGIGQIFLNDIDDAIEDVIWIKEHGLRGGVLLPTVPPDVDWIRPLNHPDYDRLWAVCEDLDVPLNCHGGQGSPAYAAVPSSAVIMLTEDFHYSRRPLHAAVRGLRAVPAAEVRHDRAGCAWLPPMLAQWDGMHASIADTARSASCASARAPAAQVGHRVLRAERVDRRQLNPPRTGGPRHPRHRQFMWGSDYPHDEGTHPFTPRSRCVR